jgi:nicotinate-nucleotide adenylyltransferase
LSVTVGVLGGSFDPVHDAHLALALRTLEQTPCTAVWFMPANRAVHKPNGPIASAAHRRAMLELVLADEAAFSLCTLELDHEEPQRSVWSLQHLHETWPDHEWYFILGEDSFRDLDSWYRPDELFRIASPVVAPRPASHGERPREYAGSRVTWLEGGELDLDSTSVRAKLAAGETPSGLDHRVLDYIREHGLYVEKRA